MNKAFTLTLLAAVLLSQSAGAQGVKFGTRYMKQRIEMRKQAAAKKAADRAAKETKALKAKSDGILDEYQEKVGDCIYRYVYAYNDKNMRSSETIYKKVKTDGKWGQEQLYTVGRYTYEYDTRGRLSVKTVMYDENDDFETYRVMVSYGDGVTEYTKYVYDEYEQKYRTTQRWSYYDNGVLASYTDYEFRDGTVSSTFDTNGVNTGYTFRGSKMTFGGELNSPVVTYYEGDGWDDATQQYTSWTPTKQEKYTYDANTGKLAEYVVFDEYYDGYYDADRYTYSYDELGRLVAIREYDNVGDDDTAGSIDPGGDLNGDGVIDENDRPVVATAKTVSTDNTEWELYTEEMYTYFNDDVYGVGNTWHDVFGMDGPLARIDVIDEEGERLATVFTRDADGKLTGITFPNQVTEPNHTSTDKATIDANGQILKIEEEYSYKSGSWEDDPNYNGEEYSTYSYFATEYTWENGQVTTAHVIDKYESTSNGETNSGEWHETNRYAYGDGKVTFSTYEGNAQSPNSTTVIEEQGNMRKVHHCQYGGGSYTEDEYVARYVQTEDISFVRPNLAADVEGMTADSTIVISVPGRVVCAYEGEYNSGFGYLSSDDYYSSLLDADNTAYYANTISGSTYFTVEHDGGETVCRDILGRPIYILTDGRLTREYKYYDVAQDVGSPVEPETRAAVMLTADIPAGQAYDEITYKYDAEGRLTGKTEVSVDENGTRTEEITLEYKYDEASGIASVEADAKVGVTLDGRRIGLSDNSAFSVCTVGGQVIAAGVTSYTFNSPGIYIINVGGITTKVAVK